MTASTREESSLVALRARLERVEREAAARQLQLERYAADLREIFKQERARARELRRSYVATVRALSNAVEARDAYTGKHAERVTAYGIELARAAGLDTDRLAGDDIPLAARVFAVADALDALTTDRPYRRGTRFSRAREEIRDHAGSQFDPEVIAAFDTISDETFAALREGNA